jgi:hypothetical protein
MRLFLKFILEMKIYMFQTVPLSIIRNFSLYKQQWCMSYSFADSLRAGAYAPAHTGLLTACEQERMLLLVQVC